MNDRQRIRIFISSPSDVLPERLLAERVIQRLDREFAYHFKIEAVSWNHEPLRASAGFQDQIVPPRETDIVLVILWSRLGYPLDAAQFPGPISGGEVTGTEWEFEDALASARSPRRLPDLMLYRKTAPVTAELGTDAAVKARQQESQRQIELVEGFMRRWTRDADGKAFTAASWGFADGAAFEMLVEEQLRKLLRERLHGGEETATVRWHAGSPYRGLEGFEPEHEQIFFGRTRARNELRELLVRQIARGNAFVLVMGASGSGKSSLVKASLLPEICQPGMIAGVRLVRHAIVRPGANPDPLAGLAEGLLSDTALPELGRAPLGYTAERLAGLLGRAPEDAAALTRQGLEAAAAPAGLKDAGDAHLLLVIDQLEELFTAEAVGPEARATYVAALAALARSGQAWVVATMRADFFAQLVEIPLLAALAGGEARYLLAPPDGAEIGQIIRQPAREAGLRFETDEQRGIGLDEEIRKAAAQDPASLPLLEYLLDQLWNRRDGSGRLTFAAYRALGGLEGAIGQRADEILAAQPDEVRAALPRLLRALVVVGTDPGASAAARLAALDELAPGTPARRLADALRDPKARLLVTTEDGRLRVAHEALLRHWKRAREQIAEDRADLQLRGRLEEATARWQGAAPADRDSLLLARGRPLSEAEDLVARRGGELAPQIRDFVARSGAAAREGQRRTLRRLQAVAAGFAVLAVAAAGGAWLGIEGRQAAEAQTAKAREMATLAGQQAARAEANLNEALDLVDMLVVDAVGASDRRDMRMADAKRILDRVERAVASLAADGTGDRVRDKRIMLELTLVDVHLALGDLAKAGSYAFSALNLAQQRAEGNPSNAAWQHELAAGHIKAGTVLRAERKYIEALQAFQRSFEIRERLAQSDSANLRLQHDLCTAHTLVGDAQSGIPQQLDAALASYEAALAIGMDLVAKEPGRVEWQRSLAVAHNKIGDVRRSREDHAGALAAYRKGLEIASQVADKEPSNPGWQRDLSLAHERVGAMLHATGDIAGALAAHRERLSISLRLAERDSANTMWQRDLVVAHANMAATLSASSERVAALAQLALAIGINARLRSEWPTHPLFMTDEKWLLDERRRLGN